ncbi:putative amidohydrolase [Mariniflexile fucanivorans]|uniref:Omega-amidase YafV n=1 Tax=Mariniflexile fucanivorans TaxID=264023 RepID=A0A4R1RQV6_9FLAO|nr:amidohydrolase [Mariniflexile fucanivorans]TCL68803.1 putative amidohydrolase [Mariniflexile fucanivorans]
MQDQLNIALIQSDLVWENPKQNRKNFSEKIKSIAKAVDVIVLPEMFSTGFTMNVEAVAETMDGKTVTWMQKKALKTGAAIVGSLIILEKDKYYNRLLFVEPSGVITVYDKRHTFTLAGEDKVYAAGNEKVIISYKDWKICPLVCYDLRFPVWARNIEDYDVLLYVANWPKSRIIAWDALLKARSIENMCYTIGLNRVGLDDAQNEYSGNSAVYDVLGNAITHIKPNREQVEIVVLERNHINYYRNKLKFLHDKDVFSLK